MRYSIVIAALAALAIFSTEKAFAQDTVQAPIVNKTAEYIWAKEYIGTDTVCREVWVKEPKGQWNDGISGAIKGDGNSLAGAIIGGAITNKITDGNPAGTVLGAIIGSNIANNTSQKNGGAIRRTICDEVPQYHRVKEITGYNVTYMFDGRHYKVFMKEDPGTHVTLNLKTTVTHSVRK